jgi:hypothetical protein
MWRFIVNNSLRLLSPGTREPINHSLRIACGSHTITRQMRSPAIGAPKAGYSLELRERALHHVVGDSSLVAYNRDELVEQRRPMMAAWAKFAIGTR